MKNLQMNDSLSFEKVIKTIKNKKQIFDIVKYSYQKFGITENKMEKFLKTLFDNIDLITKANNLIKEELETLKIKNILNLSNFFEKRSLKTAELASNFLSKKRKIADIGSGRGFFPMHLCRINKKIKVIAVDITWDNLLIDKIPNLEFRKSASEEHLPLDKKEVNAITLIDILHHTTKEMASSLLHECYNCLKPNGLLFMIENATPEKESFFTEIDGVSQFLKLSLEAKKMVYAFTEFFSHQFITRTNMLMTLNLLSIEEWISFIENIGFIKLHSNFLPILPHKIHQFPKGMALFMKP